MHSEQYLIINNWYVNLTGKLFKVKMASYTGTSIGSLVIEYIDGSKHIISKQEWDCLKLQNQGNKQKSQAEELIRS